MSKPRWMRFVFKATTFGQLIFVAIALAGAYGIVHDQITYTISPEYYTRFKFIQFHLLDSPLPDRLKAVAVGFQASWWMGVPIGILVGLLGFIHRGARRMFWVTLQSFVLVVAFTLAVGLIGLAYGFAQTRTIDLDQYQDWFIPAGLVDLRRYLCVGYMHNAAYLGGALSILAAWIFHLIVRWRTSNAEPAIPQTPAPPELV